MLFESNNDNDNEDKNQEGSYVTNLNLIFYSLINKLKCLSNFESNKCFCI